MSRSNPDQIEGMHEVISLLPVRNVVLFPNIPTQLLVGHDESRQLVEDAVAADRLIGVFTQIEGDKKNPGTADIHPVGVLALIHRVYKLPDDHLQVLVRGTKRIRVDRVVTQTPYLRASYALAEDRIDGSQSELALAQNLSQQFQKVVSLSSSLDSDLNVAIVNLEKQPGQLADLVASQLDAPLAEKQALLAEPALEKRLKQLTVLLNQELSILEMGQEIQNQVQEEVGNLQREHFLREQMRIIRKELGEEDGTELEGLQQQVADARLPASVSREAERELDRLRHIAPNAAEYTVVRTYLDWILALPWSKRSRERIEIPRARKVLDEDHDGLEKIKERLLEYLAVRKLKRGGKGPIFCFVGPPGVGKTSLGRSIARALGRKFVRISLGGVHDEAEIRGHRRTYIGSMPGRIIQGLRKAGTNNPVVILDELDKVGADFRGDPAAALLEVLDPEQNATFVDHYLDLPFDLSKVIFVATANQLETIPPALLDRLEIIQLSGYTEDEKVQIARNHLLPRQLKDHGLGRRRIDLDDESLRQLIRGYTREAGLRNLERAIGRICRKIARRVVEGDKGRFAITPESLADYLGSKREHLNVSGDLGAPGIVAGLAWTPSGGEVMLVEATKMKGRKGLILTGKLGDVMKESAQIALSYVRTKASEWNLPHNFFDRHDIHVHLPSGAIPKDGPSAGVAVATAILSLLLGDAVRDDVAMTGEITLTGRVLPVGGVKEKVLAAHYAGLSTVVLPERNKKDLEEVPEKIRRQTNFILVKDLDEVFAASIVGAKLRRAA
jgi:ATP-dependent Lon protease